MSKLEDWLYKYPFLSADEAARRLNMDTYDFRRMCKRKVAPRSVELSDGRVTFHVKDVTA